MVPDAVEPPPDAARVVFGAGFAKAAAFAELLASEGELRGLIGPRELPRLWTRHLLNSTAVESFIPHGVRVADVGAGAGFPGVVVAILRPDLDVHLVEPMERRTTWLSDVVREVALDNVTIYRARAEELDDQFDVVTARAVAALRKLVPWVGPLIVPGGRLLALKGERAATEIDDAAKALRKHKLTGGTVHEVLVPGTDVVTRVVEARRSTP